MPRNRYNGAEKADPFARPNEDTLQDVEDLIFGEPAEVGIRTGRIVARGISIDEIWPDLRQPRRAIPAEMRGPFNGNPAHVAQILEVWHDNVERVSGIEINLGDLLSGSADEMDIDVEGMPRWVEEYLTLVGLAQSIRTRGLINPITVNRQGDRYIIETGERRWLAHHLLRSEIGNDFAKVPAQEVQEIDPWRQADENGLRRPLNAIGMARQIALLIMAMYEHDDGVEFEEFTEIVKPGQSDQPFYAQVANGHAWKIKDGFLEKTLQATGLPSKRVLSAHRALLRIDEDLWIIADRDSWPEGRIREEQISRNQPQEDAERLPIGNHQTDESLPMGKHQGLESGGIDRFLGEKPAFERPAHTEGIKREEVDAYYDESRMRRQGPTWDDPAPPPVRHDELEYMDDDEEYERGQFASVPVADATFYITQYHMRQVIDNQIQLAQLYGNKELATKFTKWKNMTKKQVADQIAAGEGHQLASWLHDMAEEWASFLQNVAFRQLENLIVEHIDAFQE